MIIIILFILLLCLINNNKEKFSYFNLNLDINNPKSVNTNTNNHYNIDFPIYKLTDNTEERLFNNRIKLLNTHNIPHTNSIKTSNLIDSSNCCLIQKKFDSGNFSYIYTKLKDDKCNNELYELDQNNQLLFDGINKWSNNNCSIEKSKLGSCRVADFECIEFITKDACSNIIADGKQNKDFHIKTIWSNKTCQDKVY